MEKKLQTLHATHQSLQDKVVELEGSIAELQATNVKWAASYARQQELMSQREASVKNSNEIIDNRT